MYLDNEHVLKYEDKKSYQDVLHAIKTDTYPSLTPVLKVEEILSR
jgi:hypothetical protein